MFKNRDSQVLFPEMLITGNLHFKEHCSCSSDTSGKPLVSSRSGWTHTCDPTSDHSLGHYLSPLPPRAFSVWILILRTFHLKAAQGIRLHFILDLILVLDINIARPPSCPNEDKQTHKEHF